MDILFWFLLIHAVWAAICFVYFYSEFYFDSGFLENDNYLEVTKLAIMNDLELPEKKFYPRMIEAVTVCVGYADFLRQTLPYNRNHFDRLVVVTSKDDLETQQLCEYWHIECVITDKFYEKNDVFNKARGINEGLTRLSMSDWIVHLDADIYLPPRTRDVLNLLPLDKQSIYGIDRANCIGFFNWLNYFREPESLHGRDGLLRLTQFPLGSRLLNLDRDGYVPIGYFQMWNAKGADVFYYPTYHGAADRTDTLFAYNWKRDKRQFIPELIGIHLESEDAPMGVNWQGRKTRVFDLVELAQT